MKILAITLLVALSSCREPPEVPDNDFSAVAAAADEEDIEAPAEQPQEEEKPAPKVEEKKDADLEPAKPVVVPLVTIDAQYIAQKCATVAKTQTSTQIKYPLRTAGCSFNQNGNMIALPNITTARETDSVVVPLKKDAILCDVSLTSTATDLLHDDEMFLVMEKYILGTDFGDMVETSPGVPNAFSKLNGLYVWDFTKIRSMPHIVSVTKFCQGGPTACQIPADSVAGPVSFALTSADLNGAAAELVTKESMKLDLVVIGTSSANDCTRPQDWIFDLKISTIPNPNKPIP